jgi:S-(hydroxymethyl)glutathione dehydrogenase/alcohol dehydrogenase
MRTRAALLFEQPGKWQVRDVDLDPPQEHEVLVKLAAAGLCHSDDHIATGDSPCSHLPRNGGHEGAGVVVEVGPGVRGLAPGDHIVTSFIPGCGRCRWCASGMQNLCDTGALMMKGSKLDGTFRKHVDGLDVGESSFVGTFSEYSVMPEWCCIKIADHIPLATAAIVGCAVPTGWGSAVNGAETKPGDVVIVMEADGIGMNAVQGAAHAGATRVIACDPVAMKRDLALQLGATDAVETIEEAGDLARSLTNGQGADAAIITVGLMRPEHIGQAFATVRKAGTVVVTAVAPHHEAQIPVNLFELAMFQKRIQGVLYGMMSPSKDVPRLLDMYDQGRLKLDELVTRTYSLDEINTGYDDLHAGSNIRGVVVFDD